MWKICLLWIFFFFDMVRKTGPYLNIYSLQRLEAVLNFVAFNIKPIFLFLIFFPASFLHSVIFFSKINLTAAPSAAHTGRRNQTMAANTVQQL